MTGLNLHGGVFLLEKNKPIEVLRLFKVVVPIDSVVSLEYDICAVSVLLICHVNYVVPGI